MVSSGSSLDFLGLCSRYWGEALRDDAHNRCHEDYYIASSVSKQQEPNPAL